MKKNGKNSSKNGDSDKSSSPMASSSGGPSNDSSGSPVANRCFKCREYHEVINIQKEKLSTLEVRLRDCVRAYKQVLQEKSVLQETLESCKDKSTRSEEDERRFARLESNLAELSLVCGKYEAENLKNHTMIDELNRECQSLRDQLNARQSNETSDICDPNANQNGEKHKWTQTDIYFDARLQLAENSGKNSNTPDKPDPVAEPSKIFEEKYVQTVQIDADIEAPKSRKIEKAIVLPTQRETEFSNDDHLDRVSEHSETDTVFSETAAPNYHQNRPAPRRSLGSVSTVNQDAQQNSVSLFYVNELARKEIELAESRLAAREHECGLRELRWKYNVETYKLQSRVTQLEQQLKQVQMDHNQKPNLTYIRNVLIRFLSTKDKNQKTFMMNALLTALGTDPRELKEPKR
ncbi:uncharacterized protein LOC141855320 [Brevipalpus obovatus]|uniref:uncharacterized protein LOC141855320 n=1 Tax=Brevipalpus obovatus TaxID=246614 RepID=UPI003D9F2BD8